MRVLVTGASGFIGRWVVAGLTRRGHSVIAVRRRSVADDTGPDRAVHWRLANLLNPVEVESLFASEQPDGLVHCAWDTTPGAYWTSPDNLKWVAASLQLMDAFVRFGGHRAVVVGTSAEYDWSGDETLHEETSLTAPVTLYGVSKNALREVLQHWGRTNDLSLAWARVFCPFGVREHPARLVPRLIEQLASGNPLPFDNGTLVRDFLCVQDLGDALAAIFDADFEGVVNAASGRDLSIAALVKLIAARVGNDQVRFGVLPDPESQPKRVVADTTRLNQRVGWSPPHSIEDRIAEICQAYPPRSSTAEQQQN